MVIPHTKLEQLDVRACLEFAHRPNVKIEELEFCHKALQNAIKEAGEYQAYLRERLNTISPQSDEVFELFCQTHACKHYIDTCLSADYIIADIQATLNLWRELK